MSVGAEKGVEAVRAAQAAPLLYISKTDEENSDYNATFDAAGALRQQDRPLVVPHLGRQQEGHRHHRRAEQARL